MSILKIFPHKYLALITARGGSKGVHRKNIRPFAGKPLITWTIDAAISAKTHMKVLVTTDDSEIADISRIAGADVPFLRPPELANDTSTSEATALHALDWLITNENYNPDIVVLLQPTSPFRIADDIDDAIKLQIETNADAVVSITENTHPIQWLRKIDESGLLAEVVPSDAISRRQDAEKLYLLNGAVYVIKTEVLRRHRTFYPKNTKGYIMPADRSFDIDSELDFLIADQYMQYKVMNRR